MRSAWLAVFAAACAAPTTSSDIPPNIVLIMADDVGVEGFSCYDSSSYATPNIDKMAARGIRFTTCHSQPLCTPSRVKLMTGLSNARNYEAFSVLRPGETTFAHLLREAGYATCVAGKWQLLAAQHYKPPIRGSGTRPADAGFDSWCLWQVEKLGKRYWGPTYEVDGELRRDGNDVYGPDVYTQHLLDFMTAHRDAPFCCYFPMALVHSPFRPTPRSGDASAKNDPAHFGAMVEYMDEIVGRIVTHIEELGLAERTLVLFTSDNGTHRKITSQLGDFTIRGGKGKTTAAGTLVPLIALWPGTTKPGSVCADLVDFSDFYATIADCVGSDEWRDGVSFAPRLRGNANGPKREVIYCWYRARPKTRPAVKAVRFAFDGRFKMYADGRFYDTAMDVNEERELSAPKIGEYHVLPHRKLRAALERMPTR